MNDQISREFQVLLLSFRDAVVEHCRVEHRSVAGAGESIFLEPEARIRMDNAENQLHQFVWKALQNTWTVPADTARLDWVENALAQGSMAIHAVVRSSQFSTHWHSESSGALGGKTLRFFLDQCLGATAIPPGDRG